MRLVISSMLQQCKGKALLTVVISVLDVHHALYAMSPLKAGAMTSPSSWNPQKIIQCVQQNRHLHWPKERWPQGWRDV